MSSSDVWLVLHGYGQLAETFLLHFEPIEDGRRIIAPEALSRFYVRPAGPVGASWMTRENRLSEISDYVEFLNRVTESAAPAGSSITVLGFSQGAHTACRWAASRTDVHRLILWGSRLPVDLDEVAFGTALRDASITLVAGKSDRFVDPDGLIEDADRLCDMRLSAELIRFDGGHEIDPLTLTALADQGKY
jgi:predicted esterase